MTLRATLAVCVVASITLSAQAPGAKPPAKPNAAAQAPKFKAIWEPVPFNQDINLNAIACVGPETCWAVGDKSTILFTANGGTTWEVQLGGDPESTDDPLTRVFFLDAQHGWAMTSRGKIFGLSDGENWVELSDVSGTSQGVWFTTPQDGITFENAGSTTQSTVQQTSDGGKTWSKASVCDVSATIGGLPRKLQCRLFAADFQPPAIAYAGGSAQVDMRTALPVFGRSSDEGRTWTMAVVPDSKRRVTQVNFWSDRDGLLIMDRGEEVFWTADGGTTWTRATKQRLWPSMYGIGEGQIIVGIGESGGIAYSFNGGRNFTSRPLALPARVAAVTFPDAEHGYLVGQHAMVYRYRIVPIDYKREGMLAAMAAPAR